MQALWAQQEVGHAQLGYAARTKRLVQLVEDLAAHPAERMPQACEEWAATKGAYRFWDNAHVEASAEREYAGSLPGAGVDPGDPGYDGRR